MFSIVNCRTLATILRVYNDAVLLHDDYTLCFTSFIFFFGGRGGRGVLVELSCTLYLSKSGYLFTYSITLYISIKSEVELVPFVVKVNNFHD